MNGVWSNFAVAKAFEGWNEKVAKGTAGRKEGWWSAKKSKLDGKDVYIIMYTCVRV